MGRVLVDITVSMDGFVAGPNDDPERPLGEGGDRLHQWVYGLESWRERHGLAGGEANRDAEVLDDGGANTIQQYLTAGHVDEVQIHVVPVLLGDGLRLFEHLGTEPIELETTRVIDSPDVTHLKFAVVK